MVQCGAVTAKVAVTGTPSSLAGVAAAPAKNAFWSGQTAYALAPTACDSVAPSSRP
jgi:hypothetical protein